MEEHLRFIKELKRNPENLSVFLDQVLREYLPNKRFVSIMGFKKIIVVGDIHGDIDSLLKAIVIARNEGYPDKSLLVLLGDYVDRGPSQLECFLLVLRLQQLYPESTILLRGNHEPPALLPPYPHDFPFILQRLYGVYASVLYVRFLSIFDALPLAAIDYDNGLLFLHGGVPVKNYGNVEIKSLEEYLGGESPNWKPEYTEILWNDPSDYVELYEPSPRGAGFLWGEKITSFIKEMFGIEKVFRGHEPSSTGYKFYHGGRVITLFSRLGPPYFNEKACVAIVDLSLQKYEVRFECWP